MGAFNRRFDVKRIAGLPVPLAASLLGLFVSIVFALMLPWPIKVLVLLLGAYALTMCVLFVRYGENYAFRKAMLQARRHAGMSTPEHITRL